MSSVVRAIPRAISYQPDHHRVGGIVLSGGERLMRAMPAENLNKLLGSIDVQTPSIN